MAISKSEKLRKLESELLDLVRWYDLGIVPEKDKPKHLQEIKVVKEKIAEEEKKILLLKESGSSEDYNAPKKSTHARPAFSETQTDLDMDDGTLETDSGLMDTETYDSDTTHASEDTDIGTGSGEDDDEDDEDDEDDYGFSPRRSWGRLSDLEDPDGE